MAGVKKFSIKDCTLPQLAAFVFSHLKREGIDVVIVGGFAVAHYSSNKYVTQDVDMVDVSYKSKELKIAMENIGFKKSGRYYRHEDTPFVVEFPPGPLSVGNKIIKPDDVREEEISGVVVRIISPEDIVKDRLAAFIHWRDRQSLVKAAEIIRQQKLDPNSFEAFILAEGTADSINELFAEMKKQ